MVFVLDLITVLVDDRGVLGEIVYVVVGAFTLTMPNMIMCKDIKSSLDKCLCYIIIPKTMLDRKSVV